MRHVAAVGADDDVRGHDLAVREGEVRPLGVGVDVDDHALRAQVGAVLASRLGKDPTQIGVLYVCAKRADRV